MTERKRLSKQLCFLADASAALAVLVDFDTHTSESVDSCRAAFADWGTVDLAEADGSLAAGVRVPHRPGKGATRPRSSTVASRPTRQRRRAFGTSSVQAGRKSFRQITDEFSCSPGKDDELLGILRELGLKSYIGVPLDRAGQDAGCHHLHQRRSQAIATTDTDLAVAEDLSSRAAIAIENAQLYQELREADRRKDEFLATLAHELRNPLAPIRNGLASPAASRCGR